MNPSFDGYLETANDALRGVNDSISNTDVVVQRLEQIWTHHQRRTGRSSSPISLEDYARGGRRSILEESWYPEARERRLVEPGSESRVQALLGTWTGLQAQLNEAQDKLRSFILESSRDGLQPLSILDLPEEVLFRAFEYLAGTYARHDGAPEYTTRDIKNSRLVCRTFNNISSRLYIRSVSVDLTLASISRLEEISRHPNICKGVRAIKVDLHFWDAGLCNSFADFARHNAVQLRKRATDLKSTGPFRLVDNVSEEDCEAVVGEMRNIAAFWDQIASDGDETQPSSDEDEDEDADEVEAEPSRGEVEEHRRLLQTAHQKYRRLGLTQQDLHKSGKFDERIAAAMANMPGARKLWIGSPFDTEPSWFDCEDIRLPIYDALVRPMEYYDAYETPVPLWLNEELSSLPVAIRRAGVRLNDYAIYIPYVPWPSHLKPSPEVRQELPSAMEHLTKLSLKLVNCMSDDEGQESLDQFLAPCLQAPSLRSLELHVRTMEHLASAEQFHYDVGSLIASQEFPRLSHLSLSGVSFHLSDFRRFIADRRGPSLCLSGAVVRLLSGTWKEVLDAIRESGFIQSIDFTDPRGAECDDLYPQDIDEIFDPGRYGDVSPAQAYIEGTSEENPMAGLGS